MFKIFILLFGISSVAFASEEAKFEKAILSKARIGQVLPGSYFVMDRDLNIEGRDFYSKKMVRIPVGTHSCSLEIDAPKLDSVIKKNTKVMINYLVLNYETVEKGYDYLGYDDSRPLSYEEILENKKMAIQRGSYRFHLKTNNTELILMECEGIQTARDLAISLGSDATLTIKRYLDAEYDNDFIRNEL